MGRLPGVTSCTLSDWAKGKIWLSFYFRCAANADGSFAVFADLPLVKMGAVRLIKRSIPGASVKISKQPRRHRFRQGYNSNIMELELTVTKPDAND